MVLQKRFDLSTMASEARPWPVQWCVYRVRAAPALCSDVRAAPALCSGVRAAPGLCVNCKISPASQVLCGWTALSPVWARQGPAISNTTI